MLKLILSLLLSMIIYQHGLSESFTLKRLLVEVNENHPLISQLSLNSEIEGESRNRYLADQDWNLYGNSYFFHSKPIVPGPFSPSTIDQIGLSIDLQKKNWSSGGRLSLRWSSLLTDQTLSNIVIPTQAGSFSIPSGESRFYENSISLNYTLPLLRNFKGKLDRLEYEQASYSVTVVDLDAEEKKEQFLFEIGSKYLDWVLLEEQKEIAMERLRLAEDLLQESEAKRDANLVDEIDVLRAVDAVRTIRQNLMLLDTRLKAVRAELAVLTQIPVIDTATTNYDIYSTKRLPSPESAFTVLKNDSRILRALHIRKAQLIHLGSGFTEAGRAGFDLDLGLGFKNGEDEFLKSLGITKPDISIALIYTQQMGSRASKSDVARNNLQLEQIDYQINKTELELESLLNSFLIQLKELENVMTLNREEIESAQLKTAEELRMYNQGRSDLTFVIQSRDNQQNARLIYAENAVTYHRLLLSYLQISDQLLMLNKLGLDE